MEAKLDSGPEPTAKTAEGDLGRDSVPATPIASTHYIVGVGASAGGLEALGKLFSTMPPESGLSFVVVQHLSPDYKSFMVELLSKRTGVPVLRAEDDLEIKPNHIYLIPPKKNLKIYQGRLLLVDPDMSRGFNLPIDVFFRSLAEEKQHHAIGIVLSGTGSDGTMGIRAIKDAGGMVMVQSEATAQFDGMPRSAISTGLADFILPPEEMPRQLLKYLQHPFVANQQGTLREQHSADNLMQKIFALLREQCAVDFSYYKPSTIDRRIERRISINQLNSLEEYYRYLQASPREAGVLFNEFLICVTRFFRDREVFDFLEKSVVPQILNTIPPGGTIRAWVPACSTGEEAYSLAMLFAEEMRRQQKHWTVKVFATDISKSAIEAASQGLYSESEVGDVPPERLKRFFSKRSTGWQVNQGLRQMVVFAKHDLLKDPPFTKLDLVSCRNVLIYFQPLLQSRVINLLHFALKPEGWLLLGNSETAGEQADRFQTLSARHKVYRTRPSGRPLISEIKPPGPDPTWRLETTRITRSQPAGDLRILDTVYQEIISDYVPACLVLDENQEVLHVLGDAGKYLRPPSGAFTRNVLKLTSHNISVALATMLHRVNRQGRELVFENVKFKEGRKLKTIRLRVRPLKPKEKPGPPLRLVFIEPMTASGATQSHVQQFEQDQSSAQRITDLEQELALSKETLQATIEELETSNEELQATNEELMASNEELQSTNEELQSLNEELHTLNSENQNRIEELTELGNDISNLLASSRVGTMLVDSGLRIRRISSVLYDLVNLKATDSGAPLEVLSRELQCPGLIDLARQVMEDGVPRETRVAARQSRTLLLRLAPYKTETNRRSGLVMTLIDVTETSQHEALIQDIIDSMPAHVAVTDETGRILYVNEPWCRFGRENGVGSTSGGVGDSYFEVCRRALEEPYVRECLAGLQAVLAGWQPIFEMEYPCHSPKAQRWFLMSAKLLGKHGKGLVISHLDVSQRRLVGIEADHSRSLPPDLEPYESERKGAG